MTNRFRVNSPNVIHETIEGEVVLIDLATGSYYSLRDAGAVVWQAIDSGSGIDEIEAAVGLRYEGAPDEIRDAVHALVADLEREGLIRADDRPADPAQNRAAFESDGSSRAPFKPPSLEKHTDMQDLILLDPVHEVGSEGWPHAAPSDEGSA